MTLTDDRLSTSTLPSNLTTVPNWHPYTPATRVNPPRLPSSPKACRGEIRVSVERARLPWWFDDHLNQALNRLFALPPSWDGSGSAEVTLEAIQGAALVLAQIVDENSPAPQFFPLRDGGIQVEWHIGGNGIEVEVDGSGEAYVFAGKASGEVVVDGEVAADEQSSLLRTLTTFLNELALRPPLAH